MGFDNVTFPDNISYGSRAGPGFRTTIIELSSGSEERVSRWEVPRHRYDVGYGVRTYADLMVVKRFFLARRGALQSFKLKDWQDHATNAEHITYGTFTALDGADQPMSATAGTVTLGEGDGTETEFQLVKEYADDVQNHLRNITKPINGTVLVEVNAVLQTETTHYSVNYQTGIVTFVTAPPLGQTVRWGGEFDVPVRFDESVDEWLNLSFDDFGSGSYPSIPMTEERDGLAVPDRAWPGGTIDHGNQTGTRVQMNLVDGRVHTVDPQDANVVMEIQRVDDLQMGGPHFFVVNQSGTFTVDIETTAAVTVDTVAVNGIVEIILSDDGTGVKTIMSLS